MADLKKCSDCKWMRLTKQQCEVAPPVPWQTKTKTWTINGIEFTDVIEVQWLFPKVTGEDRCKLWEKI